MKKFIAAALLVVALRAVAQTDDLDALFEDPESAVVAEAAVVEDPEADILNDEGSFVWAGDFTGSTTLRAGYGDLVPSADELADPREQLALDFGGRLWFDARPDRKYRVFAKFSADYPFDQAESFRLFELFSDFNWNETVFFRFGKQTAAWGLSRFYQIADPLSVGVKDPAEPAADLEGPLALKVAVPFDVNNLYLYAVVKDSYLPEDVQTASIQDLGLGLKADFLVPVPENRLVGNGEFTVGVFGQRRLAPKAVAGFSTGIGDWQVFTDQVLSWGLDSYRLVDDGSTTEKPDTGLFWSATLGAMYVNNDWHWTVYGEYLFSAAASDDPEYLEKWTTRYADENPDQFGLPATGLTPTLAYTDLFGYLSRHNSALSLAWSELPGTDKLAIDLLWLQNWVDWSGMVTPQLTFKPFDHCSIQIGVSLVWGADTSEWVIKNYDPVSLSPQRFSGFVTLKLGGGNF